MMNDIEKERQRILKAIDKIDINSTSQINALGMKILIKDIVNDESAAK